MNVNKKLELFSAIAMRAAADTNAVVETKMDEELANACAQAEQEARLSARKLLDEEQGRAEQKKNRTILEASTASRKTLIALRAELTERLFARAERELEAYMASDAYTTALVTDLTKLAAAHPSGLTVTLCARDMAVTDTLDLTRIAVVQGEDTMRGGYIAQVNGGATRFDCSFAQGLADARAAFNGFKITD